MKPVDSNKKNWSQVGVAYDTERGDGVAIRLNRGVVLDWHDFALDTPEDQRYMLILYDAEE